MFAAEGYELALVGGPVRDLLLHRKSHDLDFCTSARPEQFEHILRRFGHDGFWDMGRKFGTLGAMRRREDGTEVKVEVTTYRSDTYDPDSRKPEVNYGDTLEGDLSRRDFTVNAMALRVPELEFVDPFGGANDLAKGVLRTPVDPRQSFDDDPLRMMRAVRFVAQLGFRIEPETAEALSDMVDRIEIVSAERVRDELVKLLLSDRPRAGIEALVDSGLADIVLPEIPALQLEIDEHHRHKDVFEHTMIVIERAVALETGPDGPVPAPDLTLRLAALLHDIGKPLTKAYDPQVGWTFHSHEVVGSKMVPAIFRALKLPMNEHMKFVRKMVFLHLRPIILSEDMVTDSAVRRLLFEAGDDVEKLMTLCEADITSGIDAKVKRYLRNFELVRRKMKDLEERDRIRNFQPPITGEIIMETYGVPPSRIIGEIKEIIKEAILEGEIPNDYEAAYALMERLADERGLRKKQ